MRLMFDRDEPLSGPADLDVQAQADGYLVVIPELSATTPNDKKNQVTVVRLPKNLPPSS
jgi:hypothetical protein